MGQTLKLTFVQFEHCYAVRGILLDGLGSIDLYRRVSLPINTKSF